jgi:hypothetical protein
LASSRIAGARATGIRAFLSWTRWLRSLQIDQATNLTKASKPFRRVLATYLLAEHHQVARDMGRSGASWGRRICPRVRNHVSRLKTQSTSKWSRVSTSCAHRAQVSESFRPWRWSLSEVQHRPCNTNHTKNLHLSGIWVFQIWRAPRMSTRPRKSAA